MAEVDFTFEWKSTLSFFKSVYAEEVDKPRLLTIELALKTLKRTYVSYVVASHKLDFCHQVTLSPTIREHIKEMLDLSIARALEAKAQIAELTFTDFINVVNEMNSFRLSYEGSYLPIPQYINKQKRSKAHKYITQNIKPKKESSKALKKAENANKESDTKLTNLVAALRIQSHFRTLKTIEILAGKREKPKKKIYEDVNAKEDNTKEKDAEQEITKLQDLNLKNFERRFLISSNTQIVKIPTDEDIVREKKEVKVERDNAREVIIIQHAWRSYQSRKQVAQLRENVQKMLNIRKSDGLFDEDEKIDFDIVAIEKEKYEEELRVFSESIFDEMFLLEATDFYFRTKEELRTWYREEQGGGLRRNYPKYPPDETLAIKQSFEDVEQIPLAIPKEQDAAIPLFQIDPSPLLPEFERVLDYFADKKLDSYEEILAFDKSIIKKNIEDSIMKSLEDKAKIEISQEIAFLQNALEVDRGLEMGYRIPLVLPVFNATNELKKEETPQKTREFLKTLLKHKLFKDYPQVMLDDWLGEHNVSISEEEAKQIEPIPELADIKSMIKENCILPMGSEQIHKLTKKVTKSVVFVGPPKTGKRMMLHIICNETKAILVDFNPEKIVYLFPKKANEQKTYFDEILSALIDCQPVVILIKNPENILSKKGIAISPGYKKFKVLIHQILDCIEPGIRILFVGISTNPYSAKAEAFENVFQKVFIFHSPGYGSRIEMWRHLIQKRGGKVTDALKLPTLAHLTSNYTIPAFSKIIDIIFTKRRLANQEHFPLEIQEFVNQLSKYAPILKSEEENYLKWYFQTGIGSKRILFLQPPPPVEVENEKDKKKDNKAKP